MSAELCWMVTGGVPAKPSFFFRREWATVVTPPLLVLFCLISMVYVFDFYGFWLNLMVFVFRHKAYLLSPYGNTHTNSFYFHKFICSYAFVALSSCTFIWWHSVSIFACISAETKQRNVGRKWKPTKIQLRHIEFRTRTTKRTKKRRIDHLPNKERPINRIRHQQKKWFFFSLNAKKRIIKKISFTIVWALFFANLWMDW